MATANQVQKVEDVPKKKRHLMEELEEDFHALQRKMGKARDNYLAAHQKELDSAKKKFTSVKNKFVSAKSKAAKAASNAKKTSGEAASNQLKKTRAASLLLGKSFGEAKQIMSTAEDKLHAAKPFDKKLAARAKVLAKFEKEWDKKVKTDSAAKAKRAKLAAESRKKKRVSAAA